MLEQQEKIAIIPMHFKTFARGRLIKVSHVLVDIDTITLCGRTKCRLHNNVLVTMSDQEFNHLRGLLPHHHALVSIARSKLEQILEGTWHGR